MQIVLYIVLCFIIMYFVLCCVGNKLYLILSYLIQVKRRRHKYAFNRCERTTNASLLTSIEAVLTWPKQSSYKTAHFRKSDKQQIGYRHLLEQPQTVPRSRQGTV